MKHKTALQQLFLPSLVLLPMIALLLLAPKNGWTEGTYTATGRYVLTASGHHMLHRSTDTGEYCYVLLLPRDEDAFAAFETGDALRVRTAPLLEELDSGLCYTEAYEPKKVRDRSTIPDLTEESLAYLEALAVDFTLP
jgi:hypothetical protein